MEHSTSHMQNVPRTLQAVFDKALPSEFSCSYNYVYSRPISCPPLFSPPPDQPAESTRISSHFLGVTLPSGPSDDAILVLGVEILTYTTKHSTFIFVSKADSTGYTSKGQRAPVRNICTAFLQWLVLREQHKRPDRRIVISLFARAQAQYLFPGSSEHSGKHILDDRQLIKWWARVLDPLIDAETMQEGGTPNASRYQGYMIIPGYDASELRAYFPHKAGSNDPQQHPANRWIAGDPLMELAEARGVSLMLPRAILPRFPDDPKARFMQDLDDEVGLVEEASVTTSPAKRRTGKWKNIHGLSRFWEAMEFRQECSSGRAVGFLWVTITPTEVASTSPPDNSDEESSECATDYKSTTKKSDRRRRRRQQGRPRTSRDSDKNKSGALKGRIVPRQPKIKTAALSHTTAVNLHDAVDGILISAENYDKLLQTLLRLDFGKTEVASHSTRKWIEEIASLCGQDKQVWGIAVQGTAAMVPTVAITRIGAVTVPGGVNDLGGMVRKKRKAPPIASE